jgi:hypothetical protein
VDSEKKVATLMKYFCYVKMKKLFLYPVADVEFPDKKDACNL